ncbi:MAG: MFS transporter [Candidatus Hodarchaeales archaeon]
MSENITRVEGHINLTEKQIKRNIRIFQITGIDITVLIVPVVVLIWIDAGLSFDEILLLQAIFTIPMFVLEIPSGSFADYWSRKGCIVIFHLIFGLGIFLYAIGDSFLMFAASEFLAGVGLAFRTGSDTALVFDTLLIKENNPTSRFGEIMATRMTLMFVSNALGAIIAGFIASWGFLRLPIFMTFIGHMFFATLVFTGYTEPPRIQAKSPKAAVLKALTSLGTKRDLQLVLLASVSALVFTRIGFWASQHQLVNDYNLGAIGMGIVLAVFNLCAGLSSIVIKKIISRFANLNTLFVILLLDGIYLLALVPGSSVLSVIIVSLIGQVTRGSRTPISQSLIQDNLVSSERATFYSLVSLIGSFVYVILSVLIRVFDLRRQEALLVGVLGIAISLGVFCLFKLKNKS